MPAITSAEAALQRAKHFLMEAGVPVMFCTLDELPTLKDNVWTVKFRYSLLMGEEIYIVELNGETGEVVGYKREKKH